MYKIKLLGILAILVLAVDVIYSFYAGSASFKRGFDHGMEVSEDFIGDHEKSYMPILLTVMPNKDVTPATLQTTDGIQQPYYMGSIFTAVPLTGGYRAAFMGISIGVLLSALFCLAGLVMLILLLVSIVRDNVFTMKNVFRLRFFSYSLTAFMGFVGLTSWLGGTLAKQSLSLPGYDFAVSSEINWSSLAMLILFTEIFAAGVRLKEDQDLTI